MGLLFALNSALFATIKDTISKRLASKVSGTVSTIASFLYALPFYLLALGVATYYNYETWVVTEAFLALVVLRALTDCAAEWLKMSSLAHGELSLIAAFYSLSPIFLLITSPIITGDPLTLNDVIGVAMVTLGSLVFMYTRGRSGSINYKGIVLALGSSIFFSLNSCFDRLAVLQSGPLISGFAMTLLSGIILIPFCKEPLLPNFKRENKLFFSRGLMETIFMVSKLIAIGYIPAPQVVAIMRLSVLLSVISGKVVFNEQNFLQRLLGSLLIIAGVSLIAYGLF